MGYDGNEEADYLARHATTMTPNNAISVPKSFIKNKIREAMYGEWQQRWDNDPTCRQTKIFFKNIDIDRSKKIIKMSRSSVSRLSQIITGHNNLLYHLSNQEPELSSICRLCDESRETFFHLIYECECTERISFDIMGKDFFEEAHTWVVGRILEFSHIPAIDALLFPGF